MVHTHTNTHTQTSHEHCNLETEEAQWAYSVKNHFTKSKLPPCFAQPGTSTLQIKKPAKEEGDLHWFYISSGYQIYHIIAPIPQNPFCHKIFPGASKKISHFVKFQSSSGLISWFPKFWLCETTQCSSPLLYWIFLKSSCKFWHRCYVLYLGLFCCGILEY